MNIENPFYKDPAGVKQAKDDKVESQNADLIEKRFDEPTRNAMEKMGELSFSELGSALMNMYEKKIRELSASDLMDNYRENRFSRPSDIDAKERLKLELMLIKDLPDSFDFVEISPVAPIGVSSVLTKIDPKTILQTIRPVEVVNDTSVVMALESAKRRMDDKRWFSSERRTIDRVHLANAHRELRGQVFTQKHLRQHFSSFTLTSAGRDIGRYEFEKDEQLMHLHYWLGCFEKLNNMGEYSLHSITVYLSDINVINSLIAEGVISRRDVIEGTRKKGIDILEIAGIRLPGKIDDIHSFSLLNPDKSMNRAISTLKKMDREQVQVLRNDYPNVRFVYDLSRTAGIGYYDGICFKIKATNRNDQEISLIDGGASNWTSQLTSDDKERFFGSGLGTEVLVNEFKV